MATGFLWFKVPAAIKVTLKGKLQPMVSGKDVILHPDRPDRGGRGPCTSPWSSPGRGVASLSMDDRFTISNMAIEAGGKNGIFPWMRRPWSTSTAGWTAPARPSRPTRTLSMSGKWSSTWTPWSPPWPCPHLPENTKTVTEVAGLPINQVVIGSCTNGRISDLRAAAAVLKGRKVAGNVRCIILPATQEIVLQAMEEGLIQTFIQAGCAVSTPTCGPCLGGHMGVMAEGERTVSTTNRNFVGRMGHVTSEIILASPAVAAASAVAGCVADPRV